MNVKPEPTTEIKHIRTVLSAPQTVPLCLFKTVVEFHAKLKHTVIEFHFINLIYYCFYTRNNYLIINNLLCGNMHHLWEVAEMANDDSKGMLKEHEDGIRMLDKKSIERYQHRVYDELDDNSKEKVLKMAKNDILNILNAMKPTKKKIILYRTVWCVRFNGLLPCYNINETVEFQIISSTSTTPYMEDAGHDFYRYEITVPENKYVLELDQFDSFIRNEEGEVLLPPMKCKIKNVRTRDNEKCKGIFELEYIDKLPVNILI